MLFPIRRQQRVKHLNPRQGITTAPRRVRNQRTPEGVCETPKSPPGDYNPRYCANTRFGAFGVKHLNPRQGITTADTPRRTDRGQCVKHLNPRQGITTRNRRRPSSSRRTGVRCETPKSPPGDYNLVYDIQRY